MGGGEGEGGMWSSDEHTSHYQLIIASIAMTAAPPRCIRPLIGTCPLTPSLSPKRTGGFNHGVTKNSLAAQVLLWQIATYEGADKDEIAEMKTSGVNVVIVRVFQVSGDRIHFLVKIMGYQIKE